MSEPSVPPPPPYYTPPPPPAGPGPGTANPNRGMMIVLSYLWLLALVPFLTEKEDREVQWHARNGLCLLVAEFVLGIAMVILQTLFFATHILAFLGCLMPFLHLILWVLILIVHIMCIMKGLKGERFIVPGVSQFADRF